MPLAERTARAAALCGRPDPRPGLQRNFGGSAEAALLRRGRDRRSDLGRGQRDLAGPAAEGGRRGCENMSSHSHPTPRLPPLQPTGPSVGEGGLGPLTRDMY